eukprot:GHVS01066774.1.p1 GENE.GHVS01066774.1~~GHVS01066774.1.p1  ORF type:complete len:132 (-),score=1.73 GHVS01066774.1:351-746(-)
MYCSKTCPLQICLCGQMKIKIILLAIIAAIGGHFVEGSHSMCEGDVDCEGICLYQFCVKIDGKQVSINLRPRPKGVCQEDLDKMESLKSNDGRFHSNAFGKMCELYSKVSYPDYSIEIDTSLLRMYTYGLK